MTEASLADLLRWEGAGGRWEVVADGAELVLALRTCTGDEVVGTMASVDPDLRAHVGGRSASD